MTEWEFEAALRRAMTHIESAIIQLASLENKDGLLLAAGNPEPFIQAFEAESERLRLAYQSGVVRCGMKVYPA